MAIPSFAPEMAIRPKPMRLKNILCLGAFALSAVFTVSPTLAADKTAETLLILDASGSMWGKVGGKAKIEIARDAVGKMLSTWKSNEALGLMVYGHRRKGDCRDIELLSAPRQIDAAAFKKQVDGLQPKGMTPISAPALWRHALLRPSARGGFRVDQRRRVETQAQWQRQLVYLRWQLLRCA